MSLCWACSTLTPVFIGAVEFRRAQNPMSQPPKINTLQLWPAIDLPKHAKTCSFCALIYEGYSRAAANTARVIEPASRASSNVVNTKSFSLLAEPIRICFQSLVKTADLFVSGYPHRIRHQKLHINSIVAFIPVDGAPNGLLEVRLRCYANDGTPAALNEDITGSTPIPSADSPEAHRRTSAWLEKCHTNDMNRHEICKMSISGAPSNRDWAGKDAPRLPTRVLDVSPGKGDMDLRLFEPNGLHGQFWALSHCWGPPDKKPPKTMKATLSEHLSGIHLESLPKSFRDAITFTRNQGVRYLWIDSLCIIQDDSDDWESESKNMAAVYEQAEVVLVAADAANPTEGLFFDRNPQLPPVELPYYVLTEDHRMRQEGSYFVWLDPIPHRPVRDWYKGPLSTRGWALQEWYLSQRRIFFTRYGIYWECSNVTYDEEEDHFEIAVSRKLHWKNGQDRGWEDVIEDYSRKQFTHLTDRLIALEGLISRFPSTSGNEYHYGLWKKNMPWQLIWQTMDKANRRDNPLKAPTWTWASVLSSINFNEAYDDMESLVRNFTFEESGQIHMSALMKPAPRILRLVRTTGLDLIDIDSRSATPAQLRDVPAVIEDDVKFVFCNNDSVLLGYAYLDEQDLDEVSEGIFVIPLFGYPQGCEERKESDNTADRLLLVKQSCYGFTRVGVGKIWSRWFDDAGDYKDIILH